MKDFRKIYDRIDYSAMAAGCSCWLWLGSHDDDGYGKVTIIHIRGKIHIRKLAHRISYELKTGSIIPSGMMVLHSCDEPSCINPDHLYLGTHNDNMRDKVKRGRSLKNEQNPNAKLTVGEVEEIRREYYAEKYSQEKIALKHGIGQSHISRIIRREAWKTIPLEVANVP